MYIPDWALVRQLKAYDDKLSVRWIPRLQRWGIYRQVSRGLYDKDILVMIVRGPGNSFRPLDGRVLRHLQQMDGHVRGANTIADELIASTEKAQATKAKQYKRDVDAITREIEPQARREMAETIGSTNVPKEDVQAALKQKYGEEVLDAG